MNAHSIRKKDICDIQFNVSARIWIFFKNRTLLKFFSELFAKEELSFHGEKLANVYKMRVSYARTFCNNLVTIQ